MAKWLSEQGRGAKAALARRLEIDQQVVNNWLARGNVPRDRLEDICSAMGVSEDRYRMDAGDLTGSPRPQGEIDADGLLRDLEVLPPGLRAYIARKAAELREVWEKHPILHSVFTPPTNGEHYKAWEREIEALMHKLRKDNGAEP